jgi:MFS family permease
MLALMFLLGGILNSFFLGSIVDKYQCYKKIVTGLCACTVLFMGVTFGTLRSSNHIFFCVNMIFVGASVLPITSISYAFSAELAYPVPDSLANGFMIMIALLWAVCLGLISASICTTYGTPVAFGLWMIMALLAAIISLFIK